MFKKRKAQSTLEYITVFAAIVSVIVIGAATYLRPAINNYLNAAKTKITTEAAKINQ